MAVDADPHEHHHAKPDFAAVQRGVIAEDHLIFFQFFHLTPAGRGRKVNGIGQRLIGGSRILLQERQQGDIGRCQRVFRHNFPVLILKG
ncbi:hypothetical protein BN131_3842 [Cronobacter malonaticus 681]|nr:hypothetical protein BN131_3842 [Cronobacter malonaticus 681]